MDNIVIRRTVSLDSLGKTEMLHGITFTGEAGAHTFEISCTRDGSAVNLTGNCTAYFLRSDNETIALGHKAQAGDPRRNYARIENGKALVTLHPDCYNVPGRFKLSIYASVNNDSMCVYSCVGVTERTTSETIVDSGAAIPNLNQLQNAVINVNSAIANAEAATTAAEKVNIAQSKSGNVITVTTTNRNNVQTNKTITEPTATMSKAENGDYTITVTDANGSTSYTIEDTEAAVRKKATIEAVSRVKTALGNPLTITDGMDAPAVKTVVTLEPKQDLHGYDHPWVGGSGKNLIVDELFGGVSSITADGVTMTAKNGGFHLEGSSGTDSSTRRALKTKEFTLKAGTYTFSKSASDNIIAVIQPASAAMYYITLAPADTRKTYTFSEDVTVVFGVNAVQNTTYNTDIHVQLEAGDTATTYEPYSNICPIEGYDKVSVTSHGSKNLVSGRLYNYSVGTHGISQAVNQFSTYYARVKKGEEYILVSDDGEAVYGYIDADTVETNAQFCPEYPTRFVESMTKSGSIYYRVITAKVNGWIAWRGTLDFQQGAIYKGTTLPANYIAPNTNPTLSLSVAQAAGATVYGGTVTLNEDGSGTLVVDRAVYTANGSETYGASNTGTHRTLAYSDLPDARKLTNAVCIVSNGIAATVHGSDDTGIVVSGRTNLSGYAIGIDNDALGIDNTATVNQRAQAMKTYLASNPIQFVYYLATPSTYTLTASQLRTLTGKNHVWTDGTKLELTYRADKYADVEKFLNAIPTGTKTGNPAVFADGADDLPFEKLTIAVEPHQEGSGDPSPDNVRPITGWDEVKVTRIGKNLLTGLRTTSATESGVTATPDGTGNFKITGSATGDVSNIWLAGGYGANAQTIFTLQAGTYTVIGVSLFKGTGDAVSKAGGTGSGNAAINGAKTFTIPSGSVLEVSGIRVGAVVSGATYNMMLNPMIVSGTYTYEQLSEFEPYQESTLPISLKYATGSTVYGGTVTINRDGTGSVVVDRAMKTYASGWGMASSVCYIDDLTVPINSKCVTCNQYICDGDAVISAASVAQNYPKKLVNQSLTSGGSHTRFLVYDATYATADAFNAHIATSPIQIVYKLATPTTYNLTAPQLASLLGNNTVWCDAGQVTVKYKRDIAKAITTIEASLISAGLWEGSAVVAPGA